MTDIARSLPKPIYHAKGGASTLAALKDLTETFKRWPLWMRMAWQDIKLRYRGSMLGPFWLTLSMAVTIIVMGFVYGKLLKSSNKDYFPFLTLGLIQWGYMSTVMQEACITFINSNTFIKQVRLPYTIYVLRTIMRNLVVYAHNFAIYIVIAIIFGIWPGATLWLLVPGFILLLINSLWAVMLLAIICARFRDIIPIVSSLVQLVFFVTPVFWQPDMLQEHHWVVLWNPFYHFLELIRAPLLGHTTSLFSYAYCTGTSLVGIAVTFAIFRRFRARIAYWV